MAEIPRNDPLYNSHVVTSLKGVCLPCLLVCSAGFNTKQWFRVLRAINLEAFLRVPGNHAGIHVLVFNKKGPMV